jgi:hypothetical protein
MTRGPLFPPLAMVKTPIPILSAQNLLIEPASQLDDKYPLWKACVVIQGLVHGS